jgi:hypothetical protein
VPADDVDAVKFAATTGSTYVVETFIPAAGGTDTTIRVYDPTGVLVGQNNDKVVGNRGSRLQFAAQKTGNYCVLVTGASRGQYDIGVTNVTSPPPAPPPPSVTGSGSAGASGAPGSGSGGEAAVRVRIVSATAARGQVSVVVEVQAPGSLASEVAVGWQANSGPARQTPAQTGQGTYRAAFSFAATGVLQLQAQATVGSQVVRSETRTVSSGG